MKITETFFAAFLICCNSVCCVFTVNWGASKMKRPKVKLYKTWWEKVGDAAVKHAADHHGTQLISFCYRFLKPSHEGSQQAGPKTGVTYRRTTATSGPFWAPRSLVAAPHAQRCGTSLHGSKCWQPFHSSRHLAPTALPWQQQGAGCNPPRSWLGVSQAGSHQLTASSLCSYFSWASL